MNLTGVTSGKLSYWDKTDVVSPDKIGNPKKPTVVYQWKHVMQLQVIMRLKEKLSLQEIRKILDFLESRNYNNSLFECKLFFVGTELYLVENSKEFADYIVKASGDNRGELVLKEVEPFKSILAGLKAEENCVPDFEKRIKGTPLEFALS